MRALVTIATGVLLGLMVSDASAQPPTWIGTCAASLIVRIGTRFSARLIKPRNGEPSEGSTVELKNGVYGVDYEYVEPLGKSRANNRVTTCLTSIPKGCPKGDDRGKFYTTTNLRMQESWSLPVSQHLCGRA